MRELLDTTVALGWRALGEPSSTSRPLRQAPEENQGFTEVSCYLFQKPRGPGWTFHVDDQPLHDSPGDDSCWIWQPGFFAGEVTAELARTDGSGHTLFLLDVAPDSKKIGREMFAQMVAELWAEDPTLVIGSEPATTPMGELGESENPWIAFARLRRYAPQFLRALIPIRERPRRALRMLRDSTQLHHVRRVDRQTAQSAARSPAGALFVDNPSESAALSDTRLDVPVVEETLDCAANRALRALASALLRRTRTVRKRLQDRIENEQESETRTLLSSRWPARRGVLDTLSRDLIAALRQTSFLQVQRPEITAAGLNAISADPLYARAWGMGWRALRTGIESPLQSERLWVSPSWEIYERWCFVALGKLLASSMPAWGWQRLVHPHRWVGGANGVDGELQLQPRFRSTGGQVEGRWSVSREREPDMVLTVRGPHGSRFLVFDAKYRSSRANVLDAMASAHIYQDSLRIGAQRPEASLLTLPSGAGAPWLEDVRFQLEHRVGVHVLSPDGTADPPLAIARLLEIVAAHDSTHP